MRRPVMYLAGLLLATGASFALAGPASAAPSHDSTRAAANPVPDWFYYSNSNANFTSVNRYRLTDNRQISNVGLLNVGTAQGDYSQANGNGVLAFILGS